MYMYAYIFFRMSIMCKLQICIWHPYAPIACVINDRSNSPESTDAFESTPTQHEAHSMSGGNTDPGGIR